MKEKWFERKLLKIHSFTAAVISQIMQSSACSSQAISCRKEKNVEFMKSWRFASTSHLTLLAAVPLTRAAGTHEKCLVLFTALAQQVRHVLNATAVVKIFRLVDHQWRFHRVVFVFLRTYFKWNSETLLNFSELTIEKSLFRELLLFKPIGVMVISPLLWTFVDDCRAGGVAVCFCVPWIDRSGAVSRRASVDVVGNEWFWWNPVMGLLVDCWKEMKIC